MFLCGGVSGIVGEVEGMGFLAAGRGGSGTEGEVFVEFENGYVL